MNIYVYRIDDHHYGAGFLRRACEKRGEIVEIWPIDDKKQITHLKSRGTKFGNDPAIVSRLAERAEKFIGGIPESDIDSLYESFMLELNALPFRKRLSAGWRIIRGKYWEKLNEATTTD